MSPDELKTLVKKLNAQATQAKMDVHDLSEEGLFLRTQRPPAPGTPLQIEFHDRSGRSVELEGTVIWVRTAADGHGPAGMGVALHALSEWDRTVLCELVESALEAL